MCGIAGIVGRSPVNQQLYDALTVLQHRGQDAAGIMTADGGELFVARGKGLVRDVFGQRDMESLRGNMGIAHVRYPTAGGNSSSEVQPFYVNAPYGICLGHNGNLTNATELASVLTREERRHLNTTSDSEVLLNVFASELQRVGTPRATPADIFAACNAVYRRCRGAYAVVAMIIGHGVLGFRDPHGIRPLILGQRRSARGMEYMLALRKRGADHGFVRDRARRGAGRSGVHRRAGPPAHQPVRAGGATHAVHLRIRVLRASPTPSSTTSRCTARACAWASGWPTSSSASTRITTSTW